jgi:hypothetical protein
MRSEVLANRGERPAEAVVSITSNPKNDQTTNFVGDRLANQRWESTVVEIMVMSAFMEATLPWWPR